MYSALTGLLSATVYEPNIAHLTQEHKVRYHPPLRCLLNPPATGFAKHNSKFMGASRIAESAAYIHLETYLNVEPFKIVDSE